MMQTVAMYHSLLPRIVYGDLSVQDALEACEKEFLEEIDVIEELDVSVDEAILTEAEEVEPEAETLPELNASDVLAEITRMLEEHKD